VTHPTVKIWFRGGERKPTWVDGRKWLCAAADSVPRRNDRTAKKVEKEKIMQFLTSVGLVEEEIRLNWKVKIGIQGKHSIGGCSYPIRGRDNVSILLYINFSNYGDV
jgi:hypothetical protein